VAKTSKPDAGSTERAMRLRKQIDTLTNQAEGSSHEPSKSGEKGRPLSPREFIHERMSDLNKKK
jgi:hypothetical protein